MPDLITAIWGAIASVGMTGAVLWIAYDRGKEPEDG